MSVKETTSPEGKAHGQLMDCLHLVSSNDGRESPSEPIKQGRAASEHKKPSTSPLEVVKAVRHKARPSEKKETQQQLQCRCKKSHCSKYYCECFTAGVVCGPKCACFDCQNTTEHQLHPHSKRKTTIPGKGCFCTRSNCQKNYCACYSSGEGCNPFCKCTNCMNIASPPTQLMVESLLASIDEHAPSERPGGQIGPQLDEKPSFPVEQDLFGDGQEREKQIWDYLIDE